MAGRTWVLLTEASEGGWGLSGHANTNEELVTAARAQIAELTPNTKPSKTWPLTRLRARPRVAKKKNSLLAQAVFRIGGERQWRPGTGAIFLGGVAGGRVTR